MQKEFLLVNKTEIKTLQVFLIGDGYWFIGYDLVSCLQEANDEYDICASENDCYLLNETDLRNINFFDEDSGQQRTFQEQLSIEAELGGDFPRFFASEDF